jgi:predicted P-loop ATPase
MALPPPPGSKSSPSPLWLRRCHRSKAGPLGNLHNALLALRGDPVWVGRFGYDQMLQTIVNPPKPIEDPDIFEVHEWLQANGLNRVGLDVVREAVEIVAREHPFHPLRDKLDALVWDGVPRLTEWVIHYLGAEDNEYHRQIGFRWPIAMVARVFRPGCKSDYMLVLEGPQGALKSQAMEALACGYYSDSLPDLASDAVRLSMHLRGKWLIEVSELSAFVHSRIESAHLKAFITRKEEIYTPKFGHYEVVEPRQCLLCGTTNDDHYLKDETGNRRYWPVKCGVVRLNEFRLVVDQILAEAVEEFRKDTPWWLDPAVEDQFFKPQQASRQWVDEIEPKVRAYLVGRSRVFLMEVAEDALGYQPSKFPMAEQRRLGAVMRQLGWQLKRSNNARYWEPV